MVSVSDSQFSGPRFEIRTCPLLDLFSETKNLSLVVRVHESKSFPPDLVTVNFIAVSINVSKTRIDCNNRCWGEGEGFLGGSMNILGSKLQNMSIHVLRRKLCRCLHFTIVFAIMSVSVAFSTHLCMISHYFTCVMSLFQSYVSCWSSSLLPLSGEAGSQ